MFGYVIANCSELDKEQISRYRRCYCGVCEEIGQRHGSLCRMALTYDMAFLVLLLSALYEPEEELKTGVCAAHPIKPHTACHSRLTAYAADMNVALAYYNCMDDWQDDKKPLSLLKAQIMHREIENLRKEYPRQMDAIKSCITELSAVEVRGESNPDAAANLFGQLMGELFVWKEDRWSSILRSIGVSMGKFIYLMDACLDIEKDRKNNSYNPLILHPGLDVKTALTMFMADCTREFEKLPIVRDADLLRNILYSGVWTRYLMAEEKRK